MKFEYYYNNVPNKGLCRNNLIYTSLISTDKKVFCQWFYNDTEYHKGQNEVVDSDLMQEKWERELKHLMLMNSLYPENILEILEIDYKQKKIFYKIDDVDIWEQSGCSSTDYSSVLPDWETQMLEIFQSYKNIGLYKYSLHPSSYFIVDGKLKSINYFFSYTAEEEKITIKSVLSHISNDRKEKLYNEINKQGITIYDKLSFLQYQMIALNSFSNNYSTEFLSKAKEIFK